MIHILLVHAFEPRQVDEQSIHLPEGVTVADALDHAGWNDRLAAVREHALGLGIWGRKADLADLLRDGDRIELYRALRVDPKVARRERFVGQGARTAGLFAQRRPNSKAGY